MGRIVVFTTMSVLTQHIKKIMPKLELIYINPGNLKVTNFINK